MYTRYVQEIYVYIFNTYTYIYFYFCVMNEMSFYFSIIISTYIFEFFLSLHNLFPFSAFFSVCILVSFDSIIHVTHLNEVSTDPLLSIHVLSGLQNIV